MCYLCAVAAGFAGGDAPGGGASGDSKYRYYPKDFGPLPVRPLHVDLTFDVKPGHVRVTNIATYVYNQCKDLDNEATPLTKVSLDCKKLQVDYVGVVLNNESNDHFTPVDVDNLRKVNWTEHVKQFEVTPSTQDEEGDMTSNNNAISFTDVTTFSVDTYEEKLHIPFPEGQSIRVGQQFIVKTVTIARPNDSDLEGIYVDFTPAQCPLTMVSQCQQYGYRKITPGIDQMPSKMYYTTTIIADARYTNISTNGNYAPGFFERDEHGIIHPTYQRPSSHYQLIDADQELDANLTQRVVMRYNIWNDPMATYLFYFGVGTYVTYSRQVEYPIPRQNVGLNGIKTDESQTTHRSFEIQLMVFPSFFTPVQCVEKLQEINDAILWAHISLGPESTEHKDARAKIYQLLARREDIKNQLHAPGSQYGVHARISSVGSKFENFPKNPSQLALTAPSDPAAVKYPAEQGQQTVALYHPESFTYPVPDDTQRAALEAELTTIRNELSDLFSTWKIDFGHSFKDVIYREIAMQNSFYGGMENRAATTIISSRIAPSSYLTDQAYLYMIGVTIHEYYHDLNGSLVTAQSPFGIWLNEAVTVHMQRYYEYIKFGFDLVRMGHVLYALDPSAGPLAVDSSPNAMAIEPEGFNTTLELISAMTYSKAPEFTKMVEKLIGVKAFHKALYHYYTKFQHGNATNQDWLDSMVHVSKDEGLYDMAKQWLQRNGHPTLYYKGVYDESKQQYTLHLRQTGFEHHKGGDSYEIAGPWRFPVDIALYDEQGTDLLQSIYNSNLAKSPNMPDEDACYTHDFKLAQETIVFSDITSTPACVSVGRTWSFFGRLVNESDDREQQSIAQIKLDRDSVTKYFAYQTIVDAIRQTVLRQFIIHAQSGAVNGKVTVDPKYVDIHTSILFDEALDQGTRGTLLDEKEMTTNPELKHEYWAMADTVTALLQSLWLKHSDAIITAYANANDPSYRQFPIMKGFSNRPYRYHLIKIIKAAYLHECVLDGVDAASWNATKQAALEKVPAIALSTIITDLLSSDIMSDRAFGVSLAYNVIASTYSLDLDASTRDNTFVLTAPAIAPGTHEGSSCVTVVKDELISKTDAEALLKKIETDFIGHADSIEQYLACISNADGANIQRFVEYLLTRPYFQYNLAGHARSFSRAWSSRRKRALLTPSGLQFTVAQCIKVGLVSEAFAYAFLQAFNDIAAFTGDRRASLVKALEDLLAAFDPVEQQSLTNNIKRILDTVKQ